MRVDVPRAILAALAFSFVALSQSQPPSPTPGIRSQKKQGETRGKASGPQPNDGVADRIVAAIDKLSSVIADWKQQQNNAKNNSSAPIPDGVKWTDRAIAFFTLILAIVGALQFLAIKHQAKTMVDALGETKKAAQAATDSAKAATDSVKVAQDLAALTKESNELTRTSLILSQRPRLIVRNITIDNPEELFKRYESKGEANRSDIRGHPPITGSFYVSNVGGTPGTITEIHSEIQVLGATGKLPMTRPYEGKTGVPTSIKIAPGQSVPLKFPTEPRTFEPGEQHSVVGGSLTIFIMGWIAYADEIGNARRAVFCRYRDPYLLRFVVKDDPDYEHAE